MAACQQAKHQMFARVDLAENKVQYKCIASSYVF